MLDYNNLFGKGDMFQYIPSKNKHYDTRTKDELFEDLCKKINPQVMDLIEKIIKQDINKKGGKK